jgi:hypothetical protein
MGAIAWSWLSHINVDQLDADQMPRRGVSF